MQKVVIELPTLYGDHHVIQVRKILSQIPGVSEVYASSAFQVVEVAYDPAHTNDLQIRLKLDEAGYLSEWSLLPESAPAQEGRAQRTRHTAVYEQTRQVVSFKQDVPFRGRPLWPCPGMGVMHKPDADEG